MSGITANQFPEKVNRGSRLIRSMAGLAPVLGLVSRPGRPNGISVYMRLKNEADWIAVSIASVSAVADEIIAVDNGSDDGTHEILQELASAAPRKIRLWRRPELDLCDLSNFALEQTSFRWVFRLDGDMVAHTTGAHSIDRLRTRILGLDPRRYFLIYLRHINLSGDLRHQDPKEMVHIEEYVHTFSDSVRFIHPERFEAVKFPPYYRPLFWYEPYVFHVNVKPARRMLLRYFWEDWMEKKDYARYPRLEDYVASQIERVFGTPRMGEAEAVCLKRMLKDHIPFDPGRFGPYPELLKPFLKNPKYRIEYERGQISGRRDT